MLHPGIYIFSSLIPSHRQPPLSLRLYGILLGDRIKEGSGSSTGPVAASAGVANERNGKPVALNFPPENL